jgi:segregation and condensation protein A
MTFETEVTSEFQLRLPVFEGPLDLLLYLIEREELEITAVSLVQVTDQYLSYLHSGDQIDAAALAEFIAIGARLLFLKSRALLPRPPTDEQPEEDLGEDLVLRLKEYRRFKEVAGSLREMEELGLRAYPRLAPPTDLPLPTGLDGVTLDLLAGIVREVLERQPEEVPEGVVERQEVSVEEKVDELSQALRRRKRVSFRAFISACRSRIEIIVAFLAVLELIKGLKLRAEQDALFSDISLVAVQEQVGA